MYEPKQPLSASLSHWALLHLCVFCVCVSLIRLMSHLSMPHHRQQQLVEEVWGAGGGWGGVEGMNRVGAYEQGGARRLRRWRGSNRDKEEEGPNQWAARWHEPNMLAHSSLFIPPNNGWRLLPHSVNNGAACFLHAALFSYLSLPWCWWGSVKPTCYFVTPFFPETKQGGIDPIGLYCS